MGKKLKTGIQQQQQESLDNIRATTSADSITESIQDKQQLKQRKREKASALLLREIKALGGDSTDLDLLKDVLLSDESDHEQEVRKIDETALKNDLSQFMKKFDFKGILEIQDEEEQQEISMVSKSNVVQEQKIIDEIAAESEIPIMSGASLIVNTDQKWFDKLSSSKQESNVNDIKSSKQESQVNDILMIEKRQLAQKLWDTDIATFKLASKKSKVDHSFITNILKNGTLGDKISALTLLVQESPVHNFLVLRDELLVLVTKKKRRETLQAVESIKDLFINSILPDRKLKYFIDQPIAINTSNEQLVLWLFEDCLKKVYHQFVSNLEKLLKDELTHIELKALETVFELLSSKPEQECNLLALLINQMGNLEKKIASKATHLLSQLLIKHNGMKLIVITEVERFMFRPNLPERARYYAVTFLNQIMLTQKDVQVADKLIHLYFSVFQAIVKTLKKDKEESDNKLKRKKKPRTFRKQVLVTSKSSHASSSLVSVDSVNSKMMASLLTGVNRAFPFAKMDSKLFEKHMDTLFLITHLANFSTSIQALTLIFHVQSQFDSLSSRFYRALYETLFDIELQDSSKIAMYLNLLHKAIDADSSIERVGAFLRRIVQTCNEGRVPFICGGLFLVGKVLQGRKELMAMLKTNEESIRIDESKKLEESVNPVKYDWKKREPEFTNAFETLMWELVPFCYHFHPTVALYARSIVALEKIPVPQDSKNYDPILNHTLTRFLERFVYKAPKKVKTLNHGTSVMQPRAIPGSGRLLTGGRKKLNVVLNDGEEAEMNFGDTPVNASNWSDQAQVPVDELFYYNYFQSKGQKKVIETKKNDKEGEEDNSEIGEEEAWDAMLKSVPEGDDDDLFADDNEDSEEIESQDEENSAQDDAVSGENDDEFEGILDQDMTSDTEHDIAIEATEPLESDNEDDDGDFATFLDEDDQLAQKPKKGRKNRSEKMRLIASKLGYSGDYFSKKGAEFATADEFESLLNAEESDDTIATKKTEIKSNKRK